ncbi:hypothetical protein CRD60_05675 [Bifidobacterium aemilianum]|uniref:Uncharacterized protein n=1 Tax=Bifidobacterium aemilianum TaxID=2493120 RepID=A0A366K7J7_9BIFI|nr:hypothetical protein [Bifidobacterium aemilianum]RBP97720.1 hypothetical protein CRD60_05675 [Bifidobacterium aemilianum]
MRDRDASTSSTSDKLRDQTSPSRSSEDRTNKSEGRVRTVAEPATTGQKAARPQQTEQTVQDQPQSKTLADAGTPGDGRTPLGGQDTSKTGESPNAQAQQPDTPNTPNIPSSQDRATGPQASEGKAKAKDQSKASPQDAGPTSPSDQPRKGLTPRGGIGVRGAYARSM